MSDKDSPVLIWDEIKPDDPLPRIKSIEYGKESIEVILDHEKECLSDER